MSIHFFSSSKTLSSLSSFSSFHGSHTRTDSSPTHSHSHTFSESMMEENIQNAESIITKWDLNSSSITKFTSLFLDNRKESKEFLKGVKDLRRAMHFLVSEHSTSDKLVLAQTLMQIAMKRLEHEFYRILSKNRDALDPESISGRSSDRSSYVDDEEEEEEGSEDEDELKRAGETITEVERVSQLAMGDLKAIAECMISSGYGKECTKIYKLIRKSIVDEGLYQLGIEQFKASHIHKMNWEGLEHMIKNWLTAVKIAVKSLFLGEKALCDHVFSASITIRESCFCEVTKEEAVNLFKFAELVAKHKKSPERIFQVMELREALTALWPEIESIFSSESTSAVKLQALSSLHKLGDSVRAILSDFESTVHKDSSKTLAAGGGIHPLTRSAMSYISSLGEYSGILSEIVSDYPPPCSSTFPESYFGSPASHESPGSAVSLHLAWLILVLLCKLDSKAELYKDVALAYLFLTNNLQFIIEKVRTSHLRDLLGDDWLSAHTKKLQQYALKYETMAWNKVFSSLPENSSLELPPEVAKECLQRFNAAFEESYMRQTSWIVPDGKLRDELKISIAKKLVPAYRVFCEKYAAMVSGERNLEALVRFGPDDLGNYLSDLFHGSAILSSSSSSSSSSCSSKGCIPH